MKKLKKVTILGSFMITALLSLQGCSNWKYAAETDREAEARLEARKAEAREASVQKGIQHYEEGDLELAKEILEAVLAEQPSHPDAMRYRDWLQKSLFCTVYTGDTLGEIAGYYYGDPEKWPVLAKANRITDPKRLKAYDRLVVPFFPACDQGKDELGRLQKRFFRGKDPTKIIIYQVKQGDRLGAIAKQYYRSTRLRFFLADYNHLERTEELKQGSSLRIPVYPVKKRSKQTRDRSSLQRARNAMEKKDYIKAHSDLLTIPKRSSSWSDAARLLGRCKSDGATHYARLGDRSLEQSDPEKACFYWEQALKLNPEDGEVRKKLEEARELIRTLQMLNDVP